MEQAFAPPSLINYVSLCITYLCKLSCLLIFWIDFFGSCIFNHPVCPRHILQRGLLKIANNEHDVFLKLRWLRLIAGMTSEEKECFTFHPFIPCLPSQDLSQFQSRLFSYCERSFRHLVLDPKISSLPKAITDASWLFFNIFNICKDSQNILRRSNQLTDIFTCAWIRYEEWMTAVCLPVARSGLNNGWLQFAYSCLNRQV
jgi:hypothetical protein